MDVHKSSLLAIFDSKQRLEVPIFQRQYVWNEEHQWLPLWEDIERQFVNAISQRKDVPAHFLGAMVLDQKQTPTGHVVVRQIIDGQQRLITFQIFLAAYMNFCKNSGYEALAEECKKFIFNTGMMPDEKIDKFKVWPTKSDQSFFSDIISAESHKHISTSHPLTKKPYARKFERRHNIIEAYFFFFNTLSYFFNNLETEHDISADNIEESVDICFQSLRNNITIVIIDLQKDDDPQVIFETLNARGEPLLPADLLRNYIFLRAAREKIDVEHAYKEHWSIFDDPFWRKEIKQGRLNRPRSDLFMQHFLASRRHQETPIKYLYVEYRHWIETISPFSSITEELTALKNSGTHFRRIIEPDKIDFLHGICTLLEIFDIKTAYPLVLFMLDNNIDAEEFTDISSILESYIVRRAICNIGTKNYNKIFISLIRTLYKNGTTAKAFKDALRNQIGESVAFPSNEQFKTAWMNIEVYRTLSSAKLVHILKKLNDTFTSGMNEKIIFSEQPTIEHIMPQSWIEHWPLPDGVKGITHYEIYSNKNNTDEIYKSAIEKTLTRNKTIHTIGNITILSKALNSHQSNAPWDQKRNEMRNHSLLPINHHICNSENWDEESITKNSELLFSKALTIWKTIT